MTDIEMKDTSKKPDEEKKVEKEPDDLFYGKQSINLSYIYRAEENLGTT
jgi:hypothetical protein